jgi:hypothetical protein
MNATETAKLVTYIEENLRASPTAGLLFVDSRHLKSRLLSKQNHVVFGRRGAGKTSLVRSTHQDFGHLDIYLNLEDYKDITFPNIVIHVLVKLFRELERHIRSDLRLWWVRPLSMRSLRQLSRIVGDLSEYIHEPDVETQQIETTRGYQRELAAEAKTHAAAGGAKAMQTRSSRVSRTLPKNKIDYLRLEIPAYKDLLLALSRLFENAPIFLIMDDFYFVEKNTQPDLIDYFHRLTKGTELFLKLATIKHRSKLYRRARDQYVGVELGHDIFEVDMDYTLDNLEELRSFMQQLLQNAIKQSGATIELDDIFAGDGFLQLCLASGGVPRDFLSLFVSLANAAVNSGSSIGKVQVNEAALGNLGTKLESMRRDSGDEDAILDGCLKRIKRHVYDNKRTNAFLIAKDDLESDRQGRQAIRELVDLRLIHLVDQNTSRAPSDGRRYEAYILDISLYDNPRPRNFSQIEPGQRDEKARKDELRASPVFALEKLLEPIPEIPNQPEKPRELVAEKHAQLELKLSEE